MENNQNEKLDNDNKKEEIKTDINEDCKIEETKEEANNNKNEEVKEDIGIEAIKGTEELIKEEIIKKTPEEMANEKLEQSKNLILKYQYKESEVILESININNLSKENIIIYLDLYSDVLYNLNKYYESTKLLTKIILEYDKNNLKAYLNLIKILLEIKEYDKANELAKKIYKKINLQKNQDLIKIYESYFDQIKAKENEEINDFKRQQYFNYEQKIFNLLKNKKKLVFIISLLILPLSFYIYKYIKS